MPEQLRKFIESIRINSEIAAFDEIKTKQGIILPILQYLNWNIFDTDEVYPEYYISAYRDRVDYNLRIGGNNKVFIEVKRVKDSLEEETQLCDYANHEDVKLAIFTNGISWEFFLPRSEGTWEQRKFYTIDIYQQDLDSIVSKFSDFLERENLESGKAIENAGIAHEGQNCFFSSFKKIKISKLLPLFEL
ncbi:MAG: hypothetical protein J7L39_03490 [Candidatus Aenigmarchaeota archaeon]|nr:hypothetical protein [Candidatus Aenigmarchaeota archaeon]